MDGLADLRMAGGADDAPARMKFQAGRVPFEADEVDQTSRLLVDISHHASYGKSSQGIG